MESAKAPAWDARDCSNSSTTTGTDNTKRAGGEFLPFQVVFDVATSGRHVTGHTGDLMAMVESRRRGRQVGQSADGSGRKVRRCRVEPGSGHALALGSPSMVVVPRAISWWSSVLLRQ